MRLIYTILFYLIVPFVFARLYWRGFKAPEYRKRWKERLAIYFNNYPSNVIWIHAVSVGEVEAVFPLIKQLQNEYRLENILITTTTPLVLQECKQFWQIQLLMFTYLTIYPT